MNNRLGETRINNFGSEMIIVGYRGARNIDVYFNKYNCTVKGVTYSDFKKGSITCPYEPRLCGVGYLGEGKYKTKENGKSTKMYTVWRNMIDRCYNPKKQEKHPTYINIKVCEEWHNFQSFAKWYEENYYEIEGQRMELDKDILVKGNKIYSPSTCVIVPKNINLLFVKCEKTRGSLPIGVTFDKKTNKYKNRFGYYNTKEEAFQSYKVEKEKHIKEIADEYRDLIPMRLYEAMINYKVSFND